MVKRFNEHFNTLEEIHCWKGYRKVGTKLKNGKRVNNCVKVENTEDESFTSIIQDFVEYTINKLKLKEVPEILLNKDKDFVLQLRAMGGYMPDHHKIWVYIGNRNTADIIRTLGHELVHAKQRELSGGKPLNGETGSKHENEANSLAGVLLRKYGHQNPNIYN